MTKQISRKSIISTVFIGLLISMCITVAATGIVALLLIGGKITESTGVYLTYITRGISCIVGFVIVGKKQDNKLALVIGICAVLYCVILSFIGILILNASLQNFWSVILSVLIAYVVACAICIRKPKYKPFNKRGHR